VNFTDFALTAASLLMAAMVIRDALAEFSRRRRQARQRRIYIRVVGQAPAETQDDLEYGR
jgi:hypothetical protein